MNARGFTLIELLVASAILAVLGALTGTLLINSLNNEARLSTHSDALTRLGAGLGSLRRDLEQAVNRSSRDERGDPQPAPLIGGVGQDNVFLQFNHAGRRQFPGRAPGSDLERIRYLFQDGDWIRLSYPYTNPAASGEWHSRRLFEDVGNLRMGFFDGATWHLAWPPTGEETAGLPRAVRISFDSAGFDDIELVVLLPAGTP